jgi:hypothetical protein
MAAVAASGAETLPRPERVQLLHQQDWMRHVGLFGRKRTVGAADQPQAGRVANGIPAAAATDAAVTGAGLPADDWEPETPFSRLRGPFDRTEMNPDDSRVDLGSLWVAIVPGVQIALQVDESTQTPVGVQLSVAGSGAYLQAYAAPRTEGIWPDIRAEVAQSVVADGGRAEVVNGSLGKELRLHQRGGAPLRLLGVDGPRWFLRALISGPAATDDRAADALIEAIRATVVDRGSQAMAPREQLPLRVPVHQSGEPAPDEPSGQRGQPRPGFADLRPFDRGPEITEVH